MRFSYQKEYICALFNARLLKPALVAYDELCRNDVAADAAVAVGFALMLPVCMLLLLSSAILLSNWYLSSFIPYPSPRS